ncbi:caspase domain-containing protein [Winogradskyella sp. PG-2]|uniref:caspase family protein n=1 Tax=Winogradskyella sp. PG-2 TaxID=754409 RepID=UPI0004585CA3|nr:caspase family protein [Winogradskyella sp. PG-2]BAO74629.1 hypothetical protein WPG_0399 [Winogradskyella sp. PG-2]
MRLVNILLLGFLVLFNSSKDNKLGGKRISTKPTGDLFIISIGINKTEAFSSDFKFCRKDSEDFIKKIASDIELEKTTLSRLKENGEIEKLKKIAKSRKKYIRKVYPYILLNEEATVENIKNALKKVIAKATTNDYFIFTFSGVSIESESGRTYLLPYVNSNMTPVGFVEEPKTTNNLFSLLELANLMDQIASKDQYVISEAGMGKTFGQNLMFRLFESNPEIIAGTDRNRIIITTNGPGYDGGDCDNRQVENGKLFDFIINMPKSHQIITNYKRFQSNLYNTEEECNSTRIPDYVKIYNEADYRDMLLRYNQDSNSRGSKGTNAKKDEDSKNEKPSQTYAFIIASNNYNNQQKNWANLKNPINDAESFSKVLEEKYNTKTKKAYNKNMEEILKSFNEFRKQIRENDKLIFFIAGHGYYSELLSDGYLVFKDSKSLDEDYALKSYLSMATMNRLLYGVNAKQVFSIFDVCYGANFELNNADLSIENYSNTEFDNGIANFISETDKKVSRIVLASGEYEVPDYWSNSLNHSPFADKLLKAFENEKDFISPGKIYSYVRGNTTKPILKKFGKHEPTGDFLLKVLN